MADVMGLLLRAVLCLHTSLIAEARSAWRIISSSRDVALTYGGGS